MSAFDGLKSVSDYDYLWPKKRRSGRHKVQPRDASEIPCLNCDQLLSREAKPPYFYCSEACRQFAKDIRYFRGCLRDGRAGIEDVQEAMLIRRALAIRGGYPEEKRHIPKKLRDEIFARDQDRCVKCGQPATEIHHLKGESNDPGDLEALCHRCHVAEWQARLVPIADLEPEMREVAESRAAELYKRIEAKKPLRPCDDDLNWNEKLRHPIARERSAAALAAVQVKKA